MLYNTKPTVPRCSSLWEFYHLANQQTKKQKNFKNFENFKQFSNIFKQHIFLKPFLVGKHLKIDTGRRTGQLKKKNACIQQ